MIDEYALHHIMGSAEIMSGQLAHLAEISLRPNVVVQVLPSGIGAHATLGGAFDVASGEGVKDMIRMESVALDVTTESPSVVRTSAIAFDKTRAEALPRTQSRDLIVRLNEELWAPKA